MSARVVAVLLVLLAALGGGALLYHQQSQSQRPAGAGALGQALLKDLKVADVASIQIREPKATLTLERRGERWAIAERAGYAADLDKVREFLVQAIELKVGQSEPIGDKDRVRLNLDASGTQVEFRDAQGKGLAALVVGRKYFKREPENAEKAAADGRFVLLPGDASRTLVVSNALAQATAKSAEWISRQGLAVEMLATLEVRAGGESWKIERAGDNAEWKLIGARAPEKLEITRANSAGYAFSTLDIADVAPGDARPEALGLDKPDTATLTTFDGLTYVVHIGKLANDQYPVTVSVSGEPKPREGKDAEAQNKKRAERIARERALDGQVLLVAKNRLEDVLKKRSELLAKAEAKKK